MPSKLLLSVDDGDTAMSIKSKDPTLDLCEDLLVHTDPFVAR